MPVFIDEVIAEVQESVTKPIEKQPAPQQMPLSQAEIELGQTLDRIQQRQHRLQVD